MTDNSVNTIYYKYNADGLRVQKRKVTIYGSDVTTNYILHGKNIVHMTQGTDTLHFWYDAQGRPAIVEYNGTKYAYIHNLQGDIVGIIDSTGAEVVQYTYDAWGKVLSVAGTMASSLGTIQPFRYRGYVYDVETGLYYLRSRYYNPEWGRFINADVLMKGNLFAYCSNNPENRFDVSGNKDSHVQYRMLSNIIQSVKNIITSICAEAQLVINRFKAKVVLGEISDKQFEYLVNYPYIGADLALGTGIYDRYEWFYNQVNHKAPMDYKREERRPWWALGNKSFYFRGQTISFEAYGNINYGYVGKALNIPDWILYAGGGFAAVTGGGDKSWRIDYFFDSETDHNNIAWGIQIYNEMWGN